jgi:hypothetical protein
MIIATVTAVLLLFGLGHGDDQAGALDQLGTLTAGHISDDIRAKQVAAVVQEMQTELERFDREHARLVEKLLLLDRNYRADTAEYRYVTRELNTLWRNTENTLVDLRFEMRNAMTRDEWKAVFEN